jgi:hypothetical protein
MLARLLVYCITMLSLDGLVDQRLEAGEVKQVTLMLNFWVWTWL